MHQPSNKLSDVNPLNNIVLFRDPLLGIMNSNK
uniref:Uncharacterized protein n=1 Tax=Lepeophtheirus salmonis TaxID=72036 RepID=A0A0K2U7S9_LEPSM